MSELKKVDFMPKELCDMAYLRRRVEVLSNAFSHGFDGDKAWETLTYDEALDLLNTSEQVSKVLRETAYRTRPIVPLSEDIKEPKEIDDRLLQRYSNITVNRDKGALKITCPLTIKRTKEHSWYVHNCLAEALNRYEAEQGQINVPAPSLFVIKRICGKSGFFIEDNDNFEAHRIVNTICETLGYTDAPERISVLSTTEISSGNYRMEIYVLPLCEAAGAIERLLPHHNAETEKKLLPRALKQGYEDE